MQNSNLSRKVLVIYCLLIALGALIALSTIFMSPSEPGNAVLFGLSLPLLVLVLVLLIALTFFAFLAVNAIRDTEWAKEILREWFGGGRFSRVTSWLMWISFVVSWSACSLPEYRFGKLFNYWMRVYPVIYFILWASSATLILFFVLRNKSTFHDLKKSKAFVLSLALFVLFLLGFSLMLSSHFGLSSSDDYWYGAGVPILVPQLAVAILGGLFFLQLERKSNFKYFDLIVFILIYALTAIVWAREPLQRSFLFTGPYPPNGALYPFADAAAFDIGSQFALIGQKIFTYNTYFFERPLYMSFLVYLHSLFGQDYGILMAVQAAILAVFPALIYSIGRSLNMRYVGFAAALVASLRGINSIAGSSYIDMANPKMAMTDFPTAIGVALIILLTCGWLKSPKEKWQYALWIGGVMGLSTMLRVNVLMLVALVPLYAFLKFYPSWKQWLLQGALIGLAIIAVTLPWELRNQALGGQMYGPIIAKFQAVIQQRYTPRQPDSFLPQGTSFASIKIAEPLLSLGGMDTLQNSPSCDSVPCFTANHFLHNIVTSVLVLPVSPIFESLRPTVKENSPFFWRHDWDGVFTTSTLIFFCVNVFFILLGISIAWNKYRLYGLTPLLIFSFYDLSNALARTSGGRYIVPIDWIISLYFLLGVFGVIVGIANAIGKDWQLFSEPSQDLLVEKPVAKNIQTASFILVALFGLGALIPLSESWQPRVYGKTDPANVLAHYESTITDAGWQMEALQSFLNNNKDAELLVGKALYPRHLDQGQGDIIFYPVIIKDFPRMTFTLIGSNGEDGVILPGDTPKYFPHDSEVVAIGCKNEKYLDALVVIVSGYKDYLYSRTPASELQCPLRQPVCNNNHVCR